MLYMLQVPVIFLQMIFGQIQEKHLNKNNVFAIESYTIDF